MFHVHPLIHDLIRRDVPRPPADCDLQVHTVQWPDHTEIHIRATEGRNFAFLPEVFGRVPIVQTLSDQGVSLSIPAAVQLKVQHITGGARGKKRGPHSGNRSRKFRRGKVKVDVIQRRGGLPVCVRLLVPRDARVHDAGTETVTVVLVTADEPADNAAPVRNGVNGHHRHPSPVG